FNDTAFRPDNGAIFENYVLLELWRNKGTGGEIQFFRTSDGTEVDFVMSRFSDKLAVECKFKSLEKPISLAGFNAFCEEESIENRYIINRNYNARFNNAQLIPGFLAPKIRFV
ncbi:MAG: DUF4143 domain-containing protein, partial [Candidatus Symbiothrix sp.]|nr:DUF4143 domain-containing protein [Candidatus Symbiothrix sp.]